MNEEMPEPEFPVTGESVMEEESAQAVPPQVEPPAAEEEAAAPAEPPAAEEEAAPAEPPAAEEEEAAPAEPPVPTTTAPLPQVAPPAPQAETEAEAARRKQQFWNLILTGDPDTVPQPIRERCGAEDDTLTEEEREHRLLGTINRSWVADYLGMPRMQVRKRWPKLRAGMARDMGVENSEREFFAALSRRAWEEDLEKRGREIYGRFYTAVLTGEDLPSLPDEGTPERRVADAAVEAATAARAADMPMAEHLAGLLNELRHSEDADVSFVRVYGALPGMFKAVDALADMEEEDRTRLYAVLQSRLALLPSAQRKVDLLEGTVRSLLRGRNNLVTGAVQGAGYVGAGVAQFAAQCMDIPWLEESAEWLDRRLRVLDDFKQFAQQGAFPIQLTDDWGMGGRIMLHVAESAPSVALEICGGAGAAVGIAASMGDTLSEARRLCPEGRMSTQTFAGIIAASLQENMDNMLNVTGSLFLKGALRQVGKVSPKAVARVGSVPDISRRLVQALVMEHEGEALNARMQQFGAEFDGVADDVDWESYGRDATDVEANLKSAAVQLPLILIAGGHVKLHHFRNPRAVLGDGGVLRAWGVEEETVNRVMAEQDTVERGRLLQQALADSKRWSSPAFFPEVMQAMKLLNTQDFRAFNEPQKVRDFLKLPYLVEDAAEKTPPAAPADAEALKRKWAAEGQGGSTRELLPALQQLEEWARRAEPQQEKPVPEALRGREPRYVSAERRLARRIEARRALNELVRHSYRFLLNRYSLDSLLPSAGRSPQTERVRQEVVSLAARAVVETARGTSPEKIQHFLTSRLERLYVQVPGMPKKEDWLRAAPKEQEEPRVAEARRIAADVQQCVQDLAEVLPQTDDFQSVLARCGSLPQAYAHLLHRELGFASHSWMPEELRTLPRERLAPGISAAFSHYTELMGDSLESSLGEGGKTYWRARRADGAYTPWHSTREKAVNDVAAAAQLNMLPMALQRRGASARRQKEARSTALTLNAYDHMCRVGADDLLRYWRDDATLLTPGVQVRLGSTGRIHPQGALAEAMADTTKRNPDEMDVEAQSLLTPYGVVQARFLARWQRELNSGLPAVRDAADFLLRQGVLNPVEVNKYRLNRLPQQGIPRLARPLQRYHAARQVLTARMAQYSMAMFLNRLRRNGPDAADIPPAAREWFATAPFYAAQSEAEPRLNKPRMYADRQDWMHRANLRAVEALQSMRGLASRVRAAEENAESPLSKDPFYSRLQEVLEPAPATRLEQGWSYFLGGRHAVSNVSHESQKLLASPLETWQRMEPAAREQLVRNMDWPDTGVPPERQLEELGAVLHDHPELNAYALDADDRRLWHMELEAPNPYAPSSLQETALPQDLSTPYKPAPVLKNGRVTPLAELPPELAQDARVLPALRLMRNLRVYGVNMPVETEAGILWKGQLYGGATGRGPHNGGFAADWKPRPALDGLLGVLDTVQEVESAGGSLSVGGVALRGLPRSAGDAWLNHVTVYRYELSAEKQRQLAEQHAREHPKTYTLALVHELNKCTNIMRLMPGESSAANAQLRAPYVVHGESGLPFTRRAAWRGEEHNDDIYQPLAGFDSLMDRNRAGKLAERLGRRFITANYEELLRRTADEESLEAGRSAPVTNRELLMQLAEDTQFSYTLEEREPEHLSPSEARMVRLFGSLLRYEYGGEAAAARQAVEDAAALHRDAALREDALNTLLNARHGSVERKRRTWRGRNVKYGFRKEAREELEGTAGKSHPLYNDLKSLK